MLADMVAAGDLPPVEERLPADPYVVVPYQEIGQYGGYAFVGRAGIGHWGDAHLLIGIEPLNRIAGDLSTQSPNVATDYELSADAKVLTVTLREGIKWSTGEPFLHRGRQVLVRGHHPERGDSPRTRPGSCSRAAS